MKKLQEAPKRASSVSETTERSLDRTLECAFGEMLRMVKDGQQLIVRPIAQRSMNTAQLQSIMFTIASSRFRLVVLLHIPRYRQLPTAARAHLALEEQNEKTYQDYICELGNNFCGAICRWLSDAGHSTGLSTPIILNNARSTDHFRAVGHHYETHIGGYTGSEALLLASVCLFVNQGQVLDVNIPTPIAGGDDSDAGELEFF